MSDVVANQLYCFLLHGAMTDCLQILLLVTCQLHSSWSAVDRIHRHLICQGLICVGF